MSTDKPLRYWLDLGGTGYPLREVTGVEALSQPFRFEVRFALEEGRGLDPEALVESSATLRLERTGLERTVTAIVSDIRVGATQKGAPEVMVVLEPRWALTRLRQDIRLFRDQTAVDTVVSVLGEHGISPELRLSQSYPMRPYNVQMRETDFAYVSRLLEDEGIFYAFLESGTMVLGDSTAAYDTISGDSALPFRPALTLDRHEDGIMECGEQAELYPGKVSLRDFNPEHPSLDMDVQAAGPTDGGPEFYEYPGEYEQPGEGSRKVKLWSDAFGCAASLCVGRSNAARLRPGATFNLTGPPPGLDEGSYVVTRVEHHYHIDQGGMGVSFEALPASVVYRPLRDTPVPTLPNPITGIVTGPPGEDIYTDKWGRVKVQFHWDRLWPRDDTCSHWIPVLQDNTGQSCSIPRIGWEVLVHFLEGDPDRPVVVGRVYNKLDPPHILLPENKTRSSIRSLSSPREEARDSTGYNEIYLEDAAGEELIQFWSEKDQNVVVANDKNETIQDNQTSAVYRDEQITIGNNNTVTVDAEARDQVKGNQTWAVAGNRSISIDKSLSTVVEGNRTFSIGGSHMRRIGVTDTAAAEKTHTEMVGGVILEASLKGNSWEGSYACALVVGGAHIEIAKQDKNEATGLARAELVGGAVLVKAGDEIGTRAEVTRATTVGGILMASSVEKMNLVGHQLLSSLSLTGAYEAPDGITFKVGDTMLVMKDGVIGIMGQTEVKLTVSGKNEQGAGKALQI